MGAYRKLLGTCGYMAPEVHKTEIYNIKKTDLFSLAVILFVMVYGSPPFSEATQNDNHYFLMSTDPATYKEFMEELSDASPEF